MDNINLDFKPEEHAAIYARKSNKNESHSIDSQLLLAREILYQRKLLLYKEYYDSESATKFHPLKRKGFSQLIQDAKDGRFKTVIVYRRDRLARKVEDLLEIKKLFKSYGVSVIFSDLHEFHKKDDYISDFIENIVMAVAELEPKIVAQRTSMGRKKKREKALYDSGGNIPYGFEKVHMDDKNMYIPEEKEADVVRDIFNKYLEDSYTQTGLGKELLQRKIEIRKANDPNEEIDDIVTNTYNHQLMAMILNPIYCGLQTINFQNKEASKHIYKKSLELFLYDDKEGAYYIDIDKFQQCKNVESIISEDLWYQVMAKWRNSYNPKEKSNYEYLFRGILKCGICNKSVYLNNNRYACSTKGCTSIKESLVIDAVLKQILDDIVHTENAKLFINKAINGKENQLSKLKQELIHKEAYIEETLLEYANNYKNEEMTAKIKTIINEEEKTRSSIIDSEREITRLRESLTRVDEIITRDNKDKIVSRLKKDISSTQEKLSGIVNCISIFKDEIVCGVKEIEYGRND